MAGKPAQDVRYAIRTFRKNSGFAAVAVLTLALGIGANTAMYSIVHAVMLRPLPVVETERLVRVYETNATRGFLTYSVSIPNYQSWRQQLQSWSSALSSQSAATGLMRLSRAGSTVSRLRRLFYLSWGALCISAGGFSEEEQRPGQHQVVVLSDGFWRRQFGQDSSVIGRAAANRRSQRKPRKSFPSGNRSPEAGFHAGTSSG